MNKITCIMLGFLLSCQAMAECDSTAKNFPTNSGPNFYGSGQTDSFRCAITGRTELSSLQQSENADLIPEKLVNRMYLRLGANAGSEGITGAKNESIFDVVVQQASLSSTSTKTATNNIELAVGYTWSDVAVELEWLSVKSIAYNGTLTRITPNLPFSTTLKGDSLLFNLQWIFHDMYNFKFYGLMALGISNNQSTSILNAGTPNVIKKKSPAYGFGVGGRFNLISTLYADMAARYLILGRCKFEAASGGRYMTLKASRTWLGVSARLLWLI